MTEGRGYDNDHNDTCQLNMAISLFAELSFHLPKKPCPNCGALLTIALCQPQWLVQVCIAPNCGWEEGGGRAHD
jgi:hypothetical protein